jgi:hypothetical protein
VKGLTRKGLSLRWRRSRWPRRLARLAYAGLWLYWAVNLVVTVVVGGPGGAWLWVVSDALLLAAAGSLARSRRVYYGLVDRERQALAAYQAATAEQLRLAMVLRLVALVHVSDAGGDRRLSSHGGEG